MLPNFKLHTNPSLSSKLLGLQLSDFHEVTQYVEALPYGRNSNKEDLNLVLSEQKGTCSTKHAFIVQTAFENEQPDIQLALGFYKMSARTNPEVKEVLAAYNLDHIPEAHNYILYKDERYDFTGIQNGTESPLDSIMSEMIILPNQIVNFKEHFHRFFIINWIKENDLALKFTTDKIWEIREECIQEISRNRVQVS